MGFVAFHLKMLSNALKFNSLDLQVFPAFPFIKLIVFPTFITLMVRKLSSSCWRHRVGTMFAKSHQARTDLTTGQQQDICDDAQRLIAFLFSWMAL